jgi:glycosyltransferase involved in cell wall biosynthesis
MDLLFFSRTLPCHSIGGMPRVAWDLATGLAGRGHAVRIITTATADGRQTAVPPKLADRLAVEHLERTPPGRYSVSWWRESRAAYRRLQRAGRQPDVVLSISAGAWPVLPLLGPVPAVLQAHGTSIAEIRSKLRSARPKALLAVARDLSWIPRNLAMHRRCQRTVAVGPMAYEALRHPLIRSALPQEKLVMIPNGIDTERFRPDAAARAAMRRQLELAPNAKVLLWASRLHHQKGTHLALSAFGRLADDDLHLVIVGDGPERASLERQAQGLMGADRVRFVGQIDNADMPRWLGTADAFVFTSIREEGLPLNILEALAMNLPVVASKTLVEPFAELADIHAVDPADAAAVAAAMRQAVLRPADSRAALERTYSRRAMILSYEALFEELRTAGTA